MSVTVSGIGPSSRTLPARTNGTPARTHSYITQHRQHTRLGRRGDAAGAVDRVDRAHVMPMAARYRCARLEIHARADVPNSACDDVVHRQRVAGQHDVTNPARDQSRLKYAGPRVHDDGTGDEAMRPPLCFVSRIIAAMRATLTSTRAPTTRHWP
jgi:hypothetical protein